jgi:hypothetical protein
MITNLKVQVQPRVHQRPTTVCTIENIARIPRFAIEALHLERRRRRLDRSVLLERKHESFVFVFADELHGRPVGFVGRAQAVEVAGDYDGVDFRPVGEDAGDSGGFFRGEV